jgi:hypothetical protein
LLWSGSRFAKVLESPLLRQCFEKDFLPTPKQPDPSCRLMASAAWSERASNGAWRFPEAGQLLGNLPLSGDPMALFLKEIGVGELEPYQSGLRPSGIDQFGPSLGGTVQQARPDDPSYVTAVTVTSVSTTR